MIKFMKTGDKVLKVGSAHDASTIDPSTACSMTPTAGSASTLRVVSNGSRPPALRARAAPGRLVYLRLGVPDERLLAEMRLRLRDGKVFGGAAAVVEIARRIWWAWPLWALSRLPGAMRPMHATYRWIARHRTCPNGACGIDAAPVSATWFLPSDFARCCAAGCAVMPRWGFMWAMAFALYAGCKWLTYRQARAAAWPSDRRRAFGYLLAWPGMDADAFLSDRAPCPARPIRVDSRRAQDALGATLIWVVARIAVAGQPASRRLGRHGRR